MPQLSLPRSLEVRLQRLRQDIQLASENPTLQRGAIHDLEELAKAVSSYERVASAAIEALGNSMSQRRNRILMLRINEADRGALWALRDALLEHKRVVE